MTKEKDDILFYFIMALYMTKEEDNILFFCATVLYKVKGTDDILSCFTRTLSVVKEKDDILPYLIQCFTGPREKGGGGGGGILFCLTKIPKSALISLTLSYLTTAHNYSFLPS